jgi:hypothetical protein
LIGLGLAGRFGARRAQAVSRVILRLHGAWPTPPTQHRCPPFQAKSVSVNKKGHKETLVARHEGNTNAVKYGVHSPRMISERAGEIVEGLLQTYQFTPPQMVAVNEAARWAALLEAIDRDLDERGLVDRRGKERYLLALRVRASASLERWLSKLEQAMMPDWRNTDLPEPTRDDYLRELQQIALGRDPSASTRDRLAALTQLIELGPKPEFPAAVTLIIKEGEANVEEQLEDSGSEDGPKTRQEAKEN